MSIPRDIQGEQMMRELRSAFVARGTSFHGWCRANGINTQNARKAVTGKWRGPKATELLESLVAGAGLAK